MDPGAVSFRLGVSSLLYPNAEPDMRCTTTRWVAVLLIVGCKAPQKQDEPPASTGHSTTTVGSASAASRRETEPADAGIPVDAAPKIGGNGEPAYRDDNGEVHGPGGPVFMGHGVTCDVAHDHCLRPEVWFSVDDFVPGKLYRAVPVFAFDSAWYDWRGRETSPTKLYRTKVAGKAPIAAGTPVIFFSAETASKSKWVDSEREALTSSRWEGGVTESASVGNIVTIKGWVDVPVDTVRLIIASKNP